MFELVRPNQVSHLVVFLLGCAVAVSRSCTPVVASASRTSFVERWRVIITVAVCNAHVLMSVAVAMYSAGPGSIMIPSYENFTNMQGRRECT